jgi:hypothetical protein
MTIGKTTLAASMAAIWLGVGLAGTAAAGTLENLERERAIMLSTLLTTDLTPAQRQEKLAISNGRLIDLERMVLRDRTLIGKTSPAVRAAFGNYDLTFLVHAATERDRALADHWLEQVGVSTQSLMNARVGRR